MPGIRRAAVFVLSDVRSGTTLLDQCLGANSQVASLGEVHWLRAYARQDRNLYDPVHPLACICGLPVSECPFWGAIQRELGRSLDSLELHSRLALGRGARSSVARVKFLPRRILRAHPTAFRMRAVQVMFGARRLAADCISLYDAAAAATGRPYCVDSSKSSFRFRAVYASDPCRTRAIVMARDYRAVVHSKMRRGESLESAAAGWNRAMSQIEALVADLPSNVTVRLRYEDLCRNPETELRRVCAFLGLTFADDMLERPTVGVHHIGGSPSKFDTQRSGIRFDASHEGVFSDDELARMRQIVEKAAKIWGY